MFLPNYTNCNSLFILFMYMFFYTFGLMCLSICLYSNNIINTNFSLNSFFFKFMLVVSLIFISGIPPIITFFINFIYLMFVAGNINYYIIYPILLLFFFFWYYIYNIIINIIFVDNYFNFFNLSILNTFIFSLSFFLFISLNFIIIEDWLSIFSLFYVILCF